jgi:tetratricopeptide (TPR) repeat protein
MKAIILIGAAVLAAAGCNSSVQTSEQANAAEPVRTGKVQSMTDHTFENRAQPQAPGTSPMAGRWSASGDPIDTTELDKAVKDAETALKTKPSDPAAKAAAADAYFKRAFALTEARQYAAALGDYRKTLKLDPDHKEAQTWQTQIIGIYEMMKKEYPKPGEEPTPLPWKG